jgi:hypothetical protein
VSNVGRLANYVVADGAIIENVNVLETTERSCFGNGVVVSAVNESGGREVAIYNGLSAQVAWLLCLCRQEKGLVEKLEGMIAGYVESAASDSGVIGECARVANSNMLRNVRVGAGARIEGVVSMFNGSVNSCSDDSAYVGMGVIARDFIFSEGSVVKDSAVVERCFVGQGAELSLGCAAKDCLFFANSCLHCGEACSILAGPYTVSHHRSTLLLAGVYSFFNAGSGTNFSNHSYKLGPVHQGVLDRGSKTGSESYLPYPCRVGPFTTVLGKHGEFVDCVDLPFSYLIAGAEGSLLLPGVNLRSIGTVRDALKWRRRDKRKVERKDDLIIYNLLNPYTVGLIMSGIAVLEGIKEDGGKRDLYKWGDVLIKRRWLEAGLETYRRSLDLYFGYMVVRRLESREFLNFSSVREALRYDGLSGQCEWVDMCGLIGPMDMVSSLVSDISAGYVTKLEAVRARIEDIYENFERCEWSWCSEYFKRVFGRDIDRLEVDDVVGLVEKWLDASRWFTEQRLQDSYKEFEDNCRKGYGIYPGRDSVRDDFYAVRGSFEENTFSNELKDILVQKGEKAKGLVKVLRSL